MKKLLKFLEPKGKKFLYKVEFTNPYNSWISSCPPRSYQEIKEYAEHHIKIYPHTKYKLIFSHKKDG